MIHYLKRVEIDVVKYDNCIKSSLNSRIYAYSWYLDIVADNWDVLVLNDYEAVFPLPWKSKYFIKYIYPPVWTQQLGVFSPFEIGEDLIKSFIKSIPKKFKKVTIQFNSGNNLSIVKTEKRVNYILPLNKSYDELYNCYRKDRKHRINQTNKKRLKIKKCSFIELKQIADEDYSFLGVSQSNFKKLNILSNFIIKDDRGFLLGVYNWENILLGGAVFLNFNHTITYLFSVATPKGKSSNAISYLIDDVVEQYSDSNYVFDFEGSMKKNIASFFRSFGSNEETYYLYKGLFNFFN